MSSIWLDWAPMCKPRPTVVAATGGGLHTEHAAMLLLAVFRTFIPFGWRIGPHHQRVATTCTYWISAIIPLAGAADFAGVAVREAEGHCVLRLYPACTLEGTAVPA